MNKKCSKTGKNILPSKDAACIVAKKMKNCRLNVYSCPHCKGWHVGNSSGALRKSDRIGQLLDQHAKSLEKRTTKGKSDV